MFNTVTLAAGLLPGVPWAQFDPSGLLFSVDVGRQDADDALETAAAWEHLSAHAQAQQFRALARFSSLRAGTDLDEFGTDEVAPVLHLSRGAADARLHLATRLSTQLPETLAVLQSGTIDLPKARAISEATKVLDGPATAAVQARVLTKAPQQTVGELRAALSRAVLAADSDAADRRHRAARNDRRVQLHPQPDGMGSLWALLQADDATAAYARCRHTRRSGRQSWRTRGVRPHPCRDGPGTRRSRPPLARRPDRQTHRATHGPVSRLPAPPAARSHRPGQGSGLLLPGMPPTRAPLRPRPHHCPRQSGRTVAGNLGPLCHHHRLKTHTSWSLSQPEPGLFIWTSPTGRVHHFRAPPEPKFT